MHRSRLAGFNIDCRTDDLEAAAKFWSAAHGLTVKPTSESEDGGYVTFAREPNDIAIELQRVTHESRVHLDVETDDQEAERARLEKLGAKFVAKVKTWTIMEAPTGQRFCLVRPARSGFEKEANRWE
jgi:predicted enzyme related to lactoylglutathione lyase